MSGLLPIVLAIAAAVVDSPYLSVLQVTFAVIGVPLGLWMIVAAVLKLRQTVTITADAVTHSNGTTIARSDVTVARSTYSERTPVESSGFSA